MDSLLRLLPIQSVAVSSAGLAQADKGIRVAGYLIDVIPAALLGLFGVIAVVGPMVAGFLITSYWLLRDIAGLSPGKLILGMRIASRSEGQQEWEIEFFGRSL